MKIKILSWTIIVLLVLTPSLMTPAFAADLSNGESLYQLEMQLTDQDSQASGLDVFRHPVIISMFYASCNYTCPLLIQALKKIDSELKPEVRNNVRILLVSFDPANDKPVALKALMQKNGLDAARWKFAAADIGKTQELAYILDVKYRQNPEGGFNHSSILTVLGPDGKIMLTEEGLAQAAEKVRDRLNAL